MGLNIGIKVACNQRGYPFDAPVPTKEEVEELTEKFSEFLRDKFPPKEESHGFHVSGIYYNEEKDSYDLDVRMHSYCRQFNENGYDQPDMYEAIFQFANRNLPRVYDWDMRLYWNG